MAEEDFRRGIRGTPWFSEYVQQYGEEPDLDTPIYDYRRAWEAGARPDTRDPEDQQYHWPSEFKGPAHPNRFVEGMDTMTGQPMSPRDRVATTLLGRDVYYNAMLAGEARAAAARRTGRR